MVKWKRINNDLQNTKQKTRYSASQTLLKTGRFLLHQWYSSCYFCCKLDDKSWMWKDGVVITTSRTYPSSCSYITDNDYWWDRVEHLFSCQCLGFFWFFFFCLCLSLSCILCAQHCKCLWIVHSWLSLRLLITFN